MAADMTRGSVPKHLVDFAIPLVLGNVLQLTYNAADSIIVGRYAGESSLAAVGAASPIMNIVLFFIVGICTGTSILMSEYYGAKDTEKLRREIATSMIVGVSFALVMMMLCWGLAPVLLALTQTPMEIRGMSTNYLRIVFLGLMFNFLYNIYAATLRAVGDSKTPIYFLSISAILNIVLDIVFVAVFHWGVKGVAYSTLIAEIISSLMCIIYVNVKVPLVHIGVKDMKVDPKLLKDTINYSWVTAMQQTCLYFGKILVQSLVNALGVDSIATFNAVDKIDDFAFHPQRSVGNAMTTLIAQNRGAKKKDRMREGLRCGMLLEVACWIGTGVIVFLFTRPIMSMFVTDPQSPVIGLGTKYLHLMSIFYFLPAMTNGIQGYFRGLGDLKLTLASTTVQIIGRVFFAYLLIPRFGVPGIAFSCMGGWFCMLAFELPFFYNRLKHS